MFWICKILKLEKDQFGIVRVQVIGNMLHLNILIKDKANIHRYFYLQLAEIPVQLSDVSVVTKFVKTLLLLRNILITNLSLLHHTSIFISERQKEDSITVSTLIQDD